MTKFKALHFHPLILHLFFRGFEMRTSRSSGVYPVYDGDSSEITGKQDCPAEGYQKSPITHQSGVIKPR
jgi:hypothetical protein